jgi:NAD(P)-dependent dehydrogenase (short-subunit alcohol dehydrogenase family)
VTSKTVIVTGASSGIGLALAESYLKRGDNVVGNARTMARLEEAAALLGNPENFLLVAGDISKPDTATMLFDRATGAFGTVDILVNNAGIFIGKPITDFTVEDVDSIVDTNLRGFFYPAQAAARHMAANGSGHIIAISACIAMQPNAKLPCSMTAMIKGGLNHIVRALAIELAPAGIQVNSVAPGIIDTPIFPRDEQTWAFLRTLAPNGKTGVTQDVVNAVQYLTDSTYVTGAIMTVDGGSTAGTW